MSESSSIYPSKTMLSETLSFLEVILSKLGPLAYEQLEMLWGVNDELTKLNSSVLDIRAAIQDAEKHQTKTHVQNNWLEKLTDALYDVEDLADAGELAPHREAMTTRNNAILRQVMIFFSRFNYIASDYKMARQIKNVRESLDFIAAERNRHFIEMSSEQKVEFDQIKMRLETHSSSNSEKMTGRDKVQKQIKGILQKMDVEHNISFIVINGMSGMGKTTLARSLFNDLEVSECFDLKIWVWVFQSFEVKIVVENIIESANNSRPNVRGMESLQKELQKIIKEKKYLLVLDDIWNESEQKWLELKNLLMGGEKGSKILITKRDTVPMIEIKNMTIFSVTLEGLSESESWSFFKEVTCIDSKELSNLELKELQNIISSKSKGIPLLIRHLGRLPSIKSLKEEVIEKDDYITSVLRLSYDILPLNLRRCFLYSSLLLQYRFINIDQLIQQWVAQGFVQSLNGSKSMEHIGRTDYFMKLCQRFFLEHSGTISDPFVTMHDWMHGFAMTVAKKEYVCISSKNDYVGEKTRYISFGHEIKSWRNLLPKLGKAKGLRAFLSTYLNDVNEVDLNALFSSFPCLRVLSLRCSNSKIVPDSIEKLRHLRYLDLSDNVDVKLLPNSIGRLINLQTLNLMGCHSLKELPSSTSNLLNLRHLHMCRCCSRCLTHMPGGMGQLTSLQTLNLFVLDRNGRGSKLGELNELKDLRGWLAIYGLDQLRSNPKEASLANLKVKGFEELNLNWSQSKEDATNDERVLKGLEPHPEVKNLSINGYGGKRLSEWMYSPQQKLTSILIENCHKLEHLGQFNKLPNLEKLVLKSITSLKFIDQNDPSYSSSSSSVCFSSLKILRLEDMPNLEGWWERESIVEDADQKHGNLLPTFPHLTKLSISNCPTLASIPRHPYSSPRSFPNLKELWLETMPNLEVCWEIEEDANKRWLSTFPCLTVLSISKCPKLASTPAGQASLKKLILEDVDPKMILSTIGTSDDPRPFSSLKVLKLGRIKDLEELPRELWRNLISLEVLYIEGCGKMISFFDDMHMHASTSDPAVKLETSSGKNKGKGVMRPRPLQDLVFLCFENLPEMVSLPIEDQDLPTLKRLVILKCPNFTSLPERIDTQLKSLRQLELVDCPLLKSLPNSMRQLNSLNELRIAGCPDLEERCKEGGEDWPKIKHVPHFSNHLHHFERDRDDDDGGNNTAHTSSSSSAAEAIAQNNIWRKMKDFITNICSLILTCGSVV